MKKNIISSFSEFGFFELLDIGTWDWNIKTNEAIYSAEWAKIAGYELEELEPNVYAWEKLVLPEDIGHVNEQIKIHLAGKTPIYEAEYRMTRKDGSIIWCQDKGKVIEFDEQGNPVRFVSAMQNVSRLKNAINELQTNKDILETEIQDRTKSLTNKDKMLREVYDIAKKLLTHDENESFDDLIHNCLRAIGEMTGQNRAYIWKSIYDSDNNHCCIQVYEWVEGIESIQGNPTFENIPYDMLPSFKKALIDGKCLNSFVCDLTQSEIEILEPQDIQSILIAPIDIGEINWGFIGLDNCKSKNYFSELEENVLLMSGSLIANAIQRRADQEKMREAEERTQIMLNATPLCCNLWDKEYNIIACNEEAVRLFDLPSQNEYLTHFSDLSPEYQPCGRLSSDMAFENISKAFKDRYCRYEWMHQKLDGEPIPSEITLVRVKYKNEYIVAGYTRDLRAHKAMLDKINMTQVELASARDEAIANTKAKSEFLAKMSHEIRTPMNAIVGMSEIILMGSVPSAIKDRVMSIKHACASLLSIINDILDFSKIESGKLEIVKINYFLPSLVNDVTNIISMRLINKPIFFTVNVDPMLPSNLVGDEVRIRQILLNLLGNAVKYTHEGYVKLSITGEITSKNTVLLVMKVSDTGIGIKEDDMQNLFSEFMQVDILKNKGVEGTGLGLAITKNLCRLMDGTISVTSVYGEGSTFTVELPQSFSEHEYKRFATVFKPEEKSVLVYESRDVYVESIKKSLEDLNVKCKVASSQPGFYIAIKDEEFSYVFLPEILMENAKSISEKLKIAVDFVLLTEFEETTSLGSIKCLPMPAHSLSIANILNDVKDTNVENSSKDKLSFIAPSARVLIVDDIATNICVAEGLMQPYQMHIDTCESGMEAIELVKNNDYDIIFMDHMMPIMDGVQATLLIRADEAYSNIPIVALTANAVSGVKEMFLSNGFNDFLAKPIEIIKLGEILEKWIPEDKKENAIEKEKEALSIEPTFTIEGLDISLGLSMTGGSIKSYLEILSVFYRDGENKIKDLKKCLENNNLPLYTTHVHALKSALASIGASELSIAAKALESAGKAEDVKFIKENNFMFLRGLDLLLININQVLDKELATENGISHEELTIKLVNLKKSIEEMDPFLTNMIMEELQNKLSGSDLSNRIIQISTHILLCEYDEAVRVIDNMLLSSSGNS
ncbi:MAG: ATP-binding protein [Synergistaceae bacterium]|nr:ATP-binding protein [Synergistaceae bacterium]